VNIGNPTEMTILELAEIINQLTDNTAKVVMHPDKRGEGDPQRRRPDIARAQQVLDWNPGIDIEEGLTRTVPYFQEHI